MFTAGVPSSMRTVRLSFFPLFRPLTIHLKTCYVVNASSVLAVVQDTFDLWFNCPPFSFSMLPIEYLPNSVVPPYVITLAI